MKNIKYLNIVFLLLVTLNVTSQVVTEVKTRTDKNLKLSEKTPIQRIANRSDLNEKFILTGSIKNTTVVSFEMSLGKKENAKTYVSNSNQLTKEMIAKILILPEGFKIYINNIMLRDKKDSIYQDRGRIYFLK